MILSISKKLGDTQNVQNQKAPLNASITRKVVRKAADKISTKKVKIILKCRFFMGNSIIIRMQLISSARTIKKASATEMLG